MKCIKALVSSKKTSDFYPMITCLTPGENELMLLPNVQAAIAALDLVPVPSKSFKTNLAIGARVDQWLTDAQKAPAIARSIPRTIRHVVKDDR